VKGNTGDSIQMSSGMHAIRLIVMELGRFIADYWKRRDAASTIAF
jgi:hypothetical protein